MHTVQRRTLSATALAWLHDQLPRAEFLVSMASSAKMVLEVTDDDGAYVGAAVAVGGMNTLSGAPLLVATLADGDEVRRALEEPLLAMAAALGAVEFLGPGDVAPAVARDVSRLMGGWASRVMEQRLMTCTAPEVPWHVRGWMRAASGADHDVLTQWMDEFSVEALGAEPVGAEAWSQQVTEVGAAMRLWEVEGTVVAMAHARRTTPVSSRIGPVYTPPAHRRNGYAAALTAHATKDLLDRGDERVVLLTDVTNATSNNVYLGVGYEDVDRHASWVATAPQA